MKRIILSALCVVPAFCMGQTLLYNDGAMVKVQAGATLFVEGGIHNTASGTIDNDGTIELEGDFLNQGTWEPSDPNTLIFSGNADSDVTAGSAVFQTVSIEKDNNAHVNLLGDMTVNTNLDFNAAGTSKIYTGNFRLKIGNTGTATGYDVNEYVVTDGTGEMEKKVNADGTFFFPIGDPTNYSPIENDYTGSGYASAYIRTRVNDVVHPDNPADATEYITRYWDVTSSGITDYENTLEGTYIPADIVLNGGNSGHIKGAVYDGADWTYAGADAGTNLVMGSTDVEDAEFTGANFFARPDLMVFLAGPYKTATHNMTTVLNTSNLIPLESPYTDAPVTVGSIPADVTDWIKIELRDPASPTTIISHTSAFLKKDGNIVDLDGTSLPLVKNGKPTSIVGIMHRNHLFIRTPNTGIDMVNTSLYDFSSAQNMAYDDASVTTNDAMNEMSDGAFAMWAGNARSNNNTALKQIRFAGLFNDPAEVLSAIGGNTATILSNVYHNADVNLDAKVRFAGLFNDTGVILATLGGNTANIWTHHQ